MREWNLTLVLHYPHDRFLLGWEYMAPDEDYDYTTFKLFLFITTFELNIKRKKLWNASANQNKKVYLNYLKV